MAAESLYLSEIVHQVVEYHFMTVDGVTAAELHAAISNGMAEIKTYTVVGPDGTKLADVKAYRRNIPDPRLSIWIDTDDVESKQPVTSN